MVDLLKVELLPVEEIVCSDGDAVVMVDSQPNTGRHSFDDELPLYAVIDHHETPGDLEEVLIRDAGDYGLRGERVAGLTGVWIGGEKVARKRRATSS